MDIFINGAAEIGNKSGWGIIVCHEGTEVTLGGPALEDASNSAKIRPFIEALKIETIRSAAASGEKLTIFSDSKYLVEGLAKSEKYRDPAATERAVAFLDLWNELFDTIEDFPGEVNAEWVSRAHNRYVDEAFKTAKLAIHSPVERRIQAVRFPEAITLKAGDKPIFRKMTAKGLPPEKEVLVKIAKGRDVVVEKACTERLLTGGVQVRLQSRQALDGVIVEWALVPPAGKHACSD